MLRRITVFILTVAIMLSVLTSAQSLAAESFTTGAYLVTDTNGVKLYGQAEETFDFCTTARKDALLNIIEVSGSFGYTVYDGIYGWVDLSSGLRFTSSMPAVTDKNTIEGSKGIKITKLPDKLTYIEGEEAADISGLEVSLIFDDEYNSAMKITGYTVSFPDLDTIGEKNVTVYYGGYSASYPVSVVKVPVTGIVLTLPSKTAYIEGEAISFDGLGVTAYFSDGRDSGAGIKLDRSEYTITGVKEGDSTLDAGTYKVTVTYMYPEIEASFHIYVSEKSVTSLKIIKIPSDPTIYQGQSFRTSDFELEATYDNGITETITDFNIEYDNMQLGTHTARIYYMDKYVAFDYTVLELKETGIEVGDATSVGSYTGTAVDFSNLKVYIVYNSGEKKLLSDGYGLTHEIDTSTVGKYPVKVTYGEYEAEFQYTVADRPQRILGDVNGDGEITAADARLALRSSAMLEYLDENSFNAADVDFNGELTASDARKILRVSAGIDSF
ncbi:MAG: bacterial Ig-like domain-containing protein [Clostridia bacterium]|nr:bacterial Ig-like domain-containing protein [Clostridia bacterium]